MHHVDEHIVELYYLGGLDDEKTRKEIEIHLTECYSCNELYSKIREFYQEVDNINSLNPKETKLLGTNSLVTSPSFIPQFHFVTNGIKRFINNAILYALTKPVKTTLSLVGALAFFLIGLNFNTLFKDNNLESFTVRSKLQRVDFLSKSGELINSLNYNMRGNLDVINEENTFNVKFSELSDLNGDGKKEFITLLHNIDNGSVGLNNLNVFLNRDNVLFSKKIGHPIKYDSSLFDDQFENKALIVDDFDKNGLQEIYVLATHRNSPVVVTKFDNNGNWVGEYWHYGWFWGMNKIKIGDKEGILLCGINDKDFNSRNPVVSFIDPTKIKGVMQSSQTPGYEGAVSFNEINYKYFPIIVPNTNGYFKPRINNLINANNSDLIKVSYSLNAEDVIGDLFLDKNFNVFEVKVIDAYLKKFGNLPQADLELLLKK